MWSLRTGHPIKRESPQEALLTAGQATVIDACQPISFTRPAENAMPISRPEWNEPPVKNPYSCIFQRFHHHQGDVGATGPPALKGKSAGQEIISSTHYYLKPSLNGHLPYQLLRSP